MISNQAATRETASIFIPVHCCLLSHQCVQIKLYMKVRNDAVSHMYSMWVKTLALINEPYVRQKIVRTAFFTQGSAFAYLDVDEV